MEWVQLASSLGLTPLNIILIGMVYFLGVKMELFPKLWGEDEEREEKVPIWASNLQTYFNHDTTEHHEKTQELLKEISIKMDRHNDMESTNHSKLEEILKYGVKCREK